MGFRVVCAAVPMRDSTSYSWSSDGRHSSSAAMTPRPRIGRAALAQGGSGGSQASYRSHTISDRGWLPATTYRLQTGAWRSFQIHNYPTETNNTKAFQHRPQTSWWSVYLFPGISAGRASHGMSHHYSNNGSHGQQQNWNAAQRAPSPQVGLNIAWDPQHTYKRQQGPHHAAGRLLCVDRSPIKRRCSGLGSPSTWAEFAAHAAAVR